MAAPTTTQTNARLGAAAILFAIGALVRNVAMIAGDAEHIVARVTVDDTYYYVKTAWNHHVLGFPTFDGIHPTNGVQLGWYALIRIVAAVVPDDTALLYATLILEALSASLAVVAAAWLGRRVAGLAGGLTLAAAMTTIAISGNVAISGMALGPSLLLWCAVAIAFVRCWDDRGDRDFLALAAALVATVWLRLDAGLPAALLTTIAAARLWFRPDQSPPTRAFAVAAGIAGTGAVTLFGGFFVLAGSFLPVSALWKQSGGTPAEATVWLQVIGRPVGWVWPIAADTPAVALTLLLALVTIAGFAAPARRATTAGLLPFALVVLLHQGVTIATVGHHAAYPFWYQAPLAVVVGWTSAVVVGWISRWAGTAGRLWVGPFALAVFVAQGVGVTGAGAVSAQTDPSGDWRLQRLRMARWIDAHLSPDARLCGFNVGELGFYSRRSVINLDGLINSYEYYKYRHDGGSARRFCTDSGGRFFVDYAGLEEMRPRSRVRHAIPLGRGRMARPGAQGMLFLLDLAP